MFCFIQYCAPVVMSEFVEQTQYSKICEKLLQEPEIRFAGFLDWMGNLVVGNFKNGVAPLKDESERRKMFIE